MTEYEVTIDQGDFALTCDRCGDIGDFSTIGDLKKEVKSHIKNFGCTTFCAIRLVQITTERV